ncbi:S-layer protein [Levilactobacillus namurensis]|uniref:S-layer protein n=1 Tax=Levilactobacillus namurensis TaxID=380393 RepID=A0AAW8W955_9LACO|nr:S-layer protein [Levilactobacillus namurensis]MDT7015262.1 S-layer protein [Levilactobacillus namurensis]
MRSSFAKSIYVGAAVLGLAGLSAVTTTTASAKSYATAGAYSKLTTDATKRNVEATGTNALYTKPGTVKGAKVVASKATMKDLADSKKSANYFRAYGVKITNRGSVYYRVVTMDQKYRGYVYGGKVNGTFGGGITSAETTKTATNPTRTTGYYLKDVSSHTLWNAPKYTQYKAKKVNMYGAKATDTFKVDQAATKTKEGSLYYHVTDVNNSAISGWIYAGKGYDTTITDNTKQDLGGLALTASEAATNDNSVTVVYNGTGSKAVFVSTDKDAKAGKLVNNAKNAAGQTLSEFVKSSAPAGYRVVGAYTNGAQYGNNVYVNVTESATSKVALYVNQVDNGNVKVAGALNVNSSISASDLSIKMDTSLLTGVKNSLISDNLTKISNSLDENGTVKGTKTYYTNAGKAYHYEFTFESTPFNSDNRNASYGDTLKAGFGAKLVEGSAKSNPTDNSWIA